MDPVDPRRRAGRNDPHTSKLAALANPRARLSQQQQMLKAHWEAWRNDRDGYDRLGMHCDEAWIAAGKEWPTVSCHHQRHRELADCYEIPYLRRKRWLDGTVVEREGLSGEKREVYEITQEGIAYCQQHWGSPLPPAPQTAEERIAAVRERLRNRRNDAP